MFVFIRALAWSRLVFTMFFSYNYCSCFNSSPKNLARGHRTCFSNSNNFRKKTDYLHLPDVFKRPMIPIPYKTSSQVHTCIFNDNWSTSYISKQETSVIYTAVPLFPACGDVLKSDCRTDGRSQLLGSEGEAGRGSHEAPQGYRQDHGERDEGIQGVL